MKGVSIAIETIVYLILAITVLSILLFFFLSQAGPAQSQYELEAKRNSLCLTYTSLDFSCAGKNGRPVDGANPAVIQNIKTTCMNLNRQFNFAYLCESDDLRCIQSCCITCPNRPTP